MQIKIISEKTGLILLYIGLSVVLITIVIFLWADFKIDTSSPADVDRFAKFGSFIGGAVGSLWTLASVILFYVALTEQRKSGKESQSAVERQIEALNRQIEEFSAQRKELEQTRKIYEIQSSTLRTQQFESNFYALLNVYLTIKNNLNQFDKTHDYFFTLYSEIEKSCADKGIYDHQAAMVSYYDHVYEENRGHLSHYFKSFYRILIIIDSNKSFSEEEKVFYAKILRSQITDFESLILYYNSQSLSGISHRPLILKYNLLKHTPLFCKPPFTTFIKEQKNNDISLFADRLNLFMIKHLDDFYDLSSEIEKVEEEFPVLKCIVGIYFYDDIELKVFLKKDIKNNNINLTEEQFGNFLYLYIYDKLVLEGYAEKDTIEIIKFRTETDENIIFGVKIKTANRLILNQDLY